MIRRKRRNDNLPGVAPLKDFPKRYDGWANIFTGLGYLQTDKRLSTMHLADDGLTEDELNSIFRSEGMGRRIIEVLTEDLFRQHFTVQGDTDGLIKKELRKISGYTKLQEAGKWSLLHGGSVGVLGINDGGFFYEPVQEDKIESIDYIHVFDRWRTIWTTADLYQDPMNPKYATPQWYTIFPINPATIGSTSALMGSNQKTLTAWGQSIQSPTMSPTSFSKGFNAGYDPRSTFGLKGNMMPSMGAFKVHESRVLRFDAPLIPLRERIRNRYWNDSYLAACYERIRGLGESYAGLETIVQEFIIGTMQIENLASMVASGQDGDAIARLSLLDRSKHIMNTMLLDKEEQYTRNSATVTGLKDLIDALVLGISCATGIPVTVLFGQSPAGLNATGASDLRRYYDKIQGMQQQILLEPFQKLVRYIMLSKTSEFGGVEIPDWDIDFPSLWSLSETEEAKRRLDMASADAIYLDRSVLTDIEVAKSRFGGSNYSMETKLSEERDEDGNLPLDEQPEATPPIEQSEQAPVANAPKKKVKAKETKEQNKQVNAPTQL